nr:hypothetical protein L203_03239 [Cryptococcus depauperatus CBS 7841]
MYTLVECLILFEDQLLYVIQ